MLGISDLLLKNLHKYDINKIEYQLRAKHQLIHKTYHLLDDLLLWSRSQFGMLDYNPQDVVVKDICDEVINSVSDCAKSKNISITFFESDYLTIKADQNMLKTILRNLLSNAIKFTHNNGQILIYTETSSNNFFFTVSDNGVGISKEDQLKLWDFTNYFSKPGTNNEQGTGLGLLICKRFVEAHGGKIWVESDPSSKSNGKGSDFKFSIPISN